MQARNEQRLASPLGLNTSHSINGSAYGNLASNGVQYNHHTSAYANPAPATNNHQDGIDGLTHAFGNIGIQGVGPIGARAGNNAMSNHLVTMPSINTIPASGQVIYHMGDGRLLVSGINTSQASFQQAMGAYGLPPAPAQFIPHFNYSGGQTVPNTHQGQVWPPQQHYSRDIPDLAADRRASWSSTEETAGPGTPSFGYYNHGLGSNITVVDHSPWTTPSPPRIGQVYLPQLAKTANGQITYMDLNALCARAPAIPRPVPAIFSQDGKGQGTLESSLQNHLNTTNVYIRGLHPDTTDEMLHSYGERFGEIQSAKSMLDQQTGLCKGLGFIKYHNFVDGENCIRGFWNLGYEAKWARESHNARLKTLGDPGNTNLYVSNLPISMNEAELAAIFDGFPIMSKKIIRDDNGISRGVGFARFETPEICDKVIENFNGKAIGEEGATLQIRFADTKDQKELKQKTAAKRQFKTAEYNTAVYGPVSPYSFPSPSSATFPSPLQGRAAMGNAIWGNHVSVSPTVPDYPRASIGYSTQAMYTMAGMKPFSENTPLSRTRYSARIPIESPGAAVGSKLTAGLKNETENGGPLCKGEATVFVEKIRLSPSKSAS